MLHVAGQGICPDGRQFLPLGLGNVEHRHHLVGGDRDLLFLHDGLSVRTDHRLPCLGIELLYFLLYLERGRGNDLDAFFAGLYMALKLLFPLGIAFYQRPALHGDQDRIVEAVIVEPGHGPEIFRVLLAVEDLPDAIFQPVRDLLHTACGVFRGNDKRNNGLGCGRLRRRFSLHWGGSFRLRLFLRFRRFFCFFALHGIARQEQAVYLEWLHVSFGNDRGKFRKQMVIGLDPPGKVFLHSGLVRKGLSVLPGDPHVLSFVRPVGADAPRQAP